MLTGPGLFLWTCVAGSVACLSQVTYTFIFHEPPPLIRALPSRRRRAVDAAGRRALYPLDASRGPSPAHRRVAAATFRRSASKIRRSVRTLHLRFYQIYRPAPRGSDNVFCEICCKASETLLMRGGYQASSSPTISSTRSLMVMMPTCLPSASAATAKLRQACCMV